MNLRTAWIALLAVAAIGVLGLLVWMTQGVNNDLHLERLKHIRAVDTYDVQLNRSLTQVHSITDTESKDDRIAITQKISTELNALDQGPQALRGLTPALDKALDQFLDTIDTKFELAFDFENRNSLLSQRLIAGIDSVPIFADKLMNTVRPADRERVSGLVSQLKTEIVTFGVSQAPTNRATINGLIEQLGTLSAQQQPAYPEALEALRNRAVEVMSDKTELVNKLGAFLARPTGPQLRAVEQAYTEWHGAQIAVVNRNRLLLAIYAAVLLVGLAALGVRLRRSFRELDRANETLEAQVEERTHDLSGALKELRASQTQLIQSEKMASLGQMVAGVAHEINTPLGYARSNTSIVRNSLKDMRDIAVAQNNALTLMTSEQATDEQIAEALEKAQAISGSISPEDLASDLDTLLDDADHGLSQITELVSSLKNFSRVDRSRTDMFNINDGIDSALKIGHNLLKHRVEIVKQYDELPEIECSPSQLNQVFLNLITNGAQAIDGEGKIFVHTHREDDGVAVRIMDTGCGMTADVRERIFEPFFTTKPVGKGTGLGLSIVYRIIEDHGGRIEVKSEPGKGSEFAIHLPLRQNRNIDVITASMEA